MRFKICKALYISFFFLACSFCFCSILLAKSDLEFSCRWISFGLWISAIVLILLAAFVEKAADGPFDFRSVKKFFSWGEFLPFLLIVFLATISRFVFLKSYPFAAVGDEVRDGGLNAMEIVEGKIKNIYGYGRYESHGLIIPIFTSLFYPIFKNSVFTYRVPAALVSILDIFALYFLARCLGGRKMAFFASLIMINLPLHLFYGRTEIVVIFSSLLTTLILIFLYFLVRSGGIRIRNFCLLGLLLGFSSGFHASVRTVVFAAFLLICGVVLYSFFTNKGDRRRMVGGLLLLTVCYFIGFGPRLLFTPPRVFFHARTVFIQDKTSLAGTAPVFKAFAGSFSNLVERYLDSLGVYTHRAAVSHYQGRKPVLAPALVPFFVLGLLSLVFLNPGSFGRYLVFYTLLIPLTNSAVTDCLNCDHRLAPVLPMAALVTASGIVSLLEAQKLPFLRRRTGSSSFSLGASNFRWFAFPLGFVLVLYISFQGYTFFSAELASKGKSLEDYLSMHIIYFLKAVSTPKGVRLTISPHNEEFFNFMHIKEQYEFFLPEVKIEKLVGDWVPKDAVYISRACEPPPGNFVLYQPCLEPRKFICPLEDGPDLKLYVESSLVGNYRD